MKSGSAGDALPSSFIPHPSSFAWLSLDPGDNDPARLMRSLVAAIELAAPGVFAATDRLCAMPDLPPADEIARQCCADLAALPERLSIVLDNYEEISAEPAHLLVRRIIAGLPSTAHLMILSRAEPPLPLGRLYVQQNVGEIRANDLQWSRDEVRRLLAGSDVALEDDQIDLLLARTEGWAAGLSLIADALARRSGAANLKAALGDSERHMMDFLDEEVFSRQPPAIQTFLMRTALLDRFCAPLADAVLAEDAPEGGSAGLLVDLQRQGMFLSALDAEHRWYRYHQIFRDLLRLQLNLKRGKDCAAEGYRRASAWCVEQQRIEEAIEHAFAAGDMTLAARTIEGHWHIILDDRYCVEGLPVLLTRWLSRLPPDLISTRPGLQVLRALVYSATFDLEPLQDALDRAELLLADAPVDDPATGAVRGDMLALRTYVALFTADPKTVHDYALAAQGLSSPRHDMVLAWMRIFEGMSETLHGGYEQARRKFYNALGEEEADSDGIYQERILSGFGLSALYAGDFPTVLLAARRLDNLSDEHSANSFTTVWGPYLRGRVLYERGDPAAEAAFAEVAANGVFATMRCGLDGRVGMALSTYAHGDAARARAYAAQVHAYALGFDSGQLFNGAASLEARLALLEGRAAEALRLAAKLDIAEGIARHPWLELPALTYALIMVTAGNLAQVEAALALLDRLLADLATFSHPYQEARLQALRAAALLRCDRADAADAAFAQALRLGESMDLYRSFVDLGQPVALLCARAAPTNAYAHGLCLRIDPITPLAPLAQPVEEPPDASLQPPITTLLTEREDVVLHLLNERLSADEIARRLVISPHTVRKHTANIFGKLGACSRREALARAHSLGLLP